MFWRHAIVASFFSLEEVPRGNQGHLRRWSRADLDLGELPKSFFFFHQETKKLVKRETMQEVHRPAAGLCEEVIQPLCLICSPVCCLYLFFFLLFLVHFQISDMCTCQHVYTVHRISITKCSLVSLLQSSILTTLISLPSFVLTLISRTKFSHPPL